MCLAQNKSVQLNYYYTVLVNIVLYIYILELYTFVKSYEEKKYTNEIIHYVNRHTTGSCVRILIIIIFS